MLKMAKHGVVVDWDKQTLPTREQALPDRDEVIVVSPTHFVTKYTTLEPFTDMQLAMFGCGCFWEVEQNFWQLKGVMSTQAGFSAGYTRNPTYEDVRTGQTGHNQVVRVVSDPDVISYNELLITFWESHDPTQGMGQGDEIGNFYRSGIYYYDEEQQRLAEESRRIYQTELTKAGFGPITTKIKEATEFYYAEDYHQQHEAKNHSYTGHGGTGVDYPRETADS